jgi:hypothetical protein
VLSSYRPRRSHWMDAGCARDRAIISKTRRLCKANLVQGEAELRSRCAFCCGRVQRGREPERANSGSAEAREQELRRIPAERLLHGGLCSAVCRKYERTAKMFHVKHFRRPFVGKFCTVDSGGSRRTPYSRSSTGRARTSACAWPATRSGISIRVTTPIKAIRSPCLVVTRSDS